MSGDDDYDANDDIFGDLAGNEEDDYNFFFLMMMMMMMTITLTMISSEANILFSRWY